MQQTHDVLGSTHRMRVHWVYSYWNKLSLRFSPCFPFWGRDSRRDLRRAHCRSRARLELSEALAAKKHYNLKVQISIADVCDLIQRAPSDNRVFSVESPCDLTPTRENPWDRGLRSSQRGSLHHRQRTDFSIGLLR